jgi:hypothetical protein
MQPFAVLQYMQISSCTRRVIYFKGVNIPGAKSPGDYSLYGGT